MAMAESPMSALRKHLSRAALGLPLALALPLLGTGCSSTKATGPSEAPPTAASARSKLVVLLVVDQLPSWTFERHVPFFHGGFARLAREGVFYSHAAYPYAATITAIGHTALVTGAEPHRSGIVGNTWWERGEGRWINSTDDRSMPTLPMQENDLGVSPQWRVAEAVGAGRRVLSLSTKARAAVLMAPSKGATVAWYDSQQSAFVTSKTYASARFDWLDVLAQKHPIAPRLDYVWTPLASTPSRALVSDEAVGESVAQGLGTCFPHRLADAKKPASAVCGTPLANELLLEAVFAGLDAVRPELLDVSFSSHDIAAHQWGQESWEATDILYRLDETIGKLLDGLDERYGKDGWSLVFSSDHGAPHMPESLEGAVRGDLDEIQKLATAAAGGPEMIAALDERGIYLSAEARALPEATRSKMLDAIVAAIKQDPSVGFAMRTDVFHKNASCTGLSQLEALVCRSVFGDRSGDIYYGPREGSVIMHRPLNGIGHGTPYDYDRNVPVIIREPGRAPRRIDDETPSVLRVAPTLARLLGTPPPPAAHEPPF